MVSMRIAGAALRLPQLLLLLCAAAAHAGPVIPDPQKVSEHAWAWIGPYGPPARENSGFRMNLGFVAGNDAVAVIDSGYGDYMAIAMLDQIERLTGRPVTHVISTNSQPHRILGNAAFRSHGATTVAAVEAVDRIVAEGSAMAEAAENILGMAAGSISPPGKPDMEVADVTTVDLGGVSLNVIPVGTAHTRGCLVVEVVEDRVVFAGDVLYGGRLLSVLSVSRVDGWIAAFDSLRRFGDAMFVPGHGATGKLADFEESTYEYLTVLKTHMDAAVADGADMQDAIDSLDQGRWRRLADFDMLAGRNAHRTYLEREEAAFD